MEQWYDNVAALVGMGREIGVSGNKRKLEEEMVEMRKDKCNRQRWEKGKGVMGFGETLKWWDKNSARVQGVREVGKVGWRMPGVYQFSQNPPTSLKTHVHTVVNIMAPCVVTVEVTDGL